MKRTAQRLLIGLLVCSQGISCLQAFDAVRTFAGRKLTTGTADGPLSLALFNDPSGLAIAPDGTLFVADNMNHTIRKVTTNGMVSTIAGRTGISGSTDGVGTNALFFNPYGLALDPAGNLLVADSGNSTIRMIGPDGVVKTIAGVAGQNDATNGPAMLARFDTPLGIAVAPGGTIYVADTRNHTIRTITPGGVVATLAGSAGIWGAADGTGPTARFNGPVGLALDAGGNVFVSDSNNHTIRKVTPAGEVTTFAGRAGTDGNTDGIGASSRFYKPGEIKFDRDYNLFVVDSFNHAIRKVTTDGVVSTIAGLAGSSGMIDGLDSQARFFNPYGLAVDRSGNLRVSDTYNQTLRLIYVPVTTTLTPVPNGFAISWSAVPGNNYQVQVQDSAGGEWHYLSSILAANIHATVTDNSIRAGQRYYRVLSLP